MSRKILLRIFFHLGFWPRAILAWWKLLLKRTPMLVDTVELDRAYYYAGSWIHLSWTVQGAWLVRVNHPGGFYHGSEGTWFTAIEGMPEIRVTCYGVRGRQRFRLPVRVKPVAVAAPMQSLSQVELASQSIHRGPVLSPRGQSISTGSFRIALPTAEVAQARQAIFQTDDPAKAREIAEQFLRSSQPE